MLFRPKYYSSYVNKKDGLGGGCDVLVQVPLARFEEFWPLAAKSLPELPQNLHVVFLVDHLAVGEGIPNGPHPKTCEFCPQDPVS